MADYTDLPDTAVGVGGTPSGTTVTALRDNPIAIAEGAVGAPRIADAALVDVTNGFIGGKIAGLSYGAVGTTAFLYASNTGIIQGNTYAGSSLSPAGIQSVAAIPSIAADTLEDAALVRGSPTMSGTWRAMGRANQSGVDRPRATLFVRIS